MAQPGNFENLFDATVVEHREQHRTMICQVIGTAIQLETPLAPVPAGSEVRIGIRADEILMVSSRPSVVGACNVIPGEVKGYERAGNTIEARVSCGGEFRIRLTAPAMESLESRETAEIWMVIRTQACHLVRPDTSRKLSRLIVFVCSGNTSRSPMAQAICNAEIARRLRVPLESLDRWGIRAVSAGLKARPGEPLTAEAAQTLAAKGLPNVAHRSLNLTRGMAQQAEIIFCMTEEQRNDVIALLPEVAAKTYCLQPLGNINDPTGKGSTAFSELADLLRRLISEQLDNLGIVDAA
jgi:protein-tyrosine-phosphatase